jgi:hypothetical protein
MTNRGRRRAPLLLRLTKWRQSCVQAEAIVVRRVRQPVLRSCWRGSGGARTQAIGGEGVAYSRSRSALSRRRSD